ncbi:glycosyltransferase family A protein [Flavobacterium sp. TAB 87]|uniref:glycosyltransferase family 2 protein n=1 Tax=Flavobacterium sp. TAB 87 TaxID=1729581 RepID=UPI00076BDF87|nr:glycosyltransferase family A protein [Flavobacterium sp. TAB 87]KVV15874.1 putative glycosyltransferase EpsJ [Flavobacterium sp. TAB 87]
MSILVSIVVPCYKQSHFLEECLQSVIEQTYSNWECIIVNDGSPDNTALVAQKWIQKDIRFKYIYKENGGLSSARNSGIGISEGDYILPLDSDDYIDINFLSRLVPELDNNKQLAIISCYSKFFINDRNNFINELKPSGRTYEDLLFQNHLVATSLYRKKCWEEVGGYDENMKKGFEDWEFWLNVTKRGWQFFIVPKFLFYYRKAKNSMLVDTINKHAEANMEYIFRKHQELYIKHFDNTAEVLFYYIKTHRLGKIEIRYSLEYKIGKMLLMPIRFISNLFSSSKNKG